MKTTQVVVIGAGGAGMMCGIQAASRGRQTVLLDHASTLGAKILISGGGRCNFTNIHTDSQAYVSQNPHFAKSALCRYLPADFIELVEKHKIAYHEKKLGQLFCDDSAQNIVAMLKKECDSAGARIILDSVIRFIARIEEGALTFKPYIVQDKENGKREVEIPAEAKGKTGFLVKTQKDLYFTESLVIATGGLSVPKVGATGIGYEIAKCFGHTIIETIPALDGFVFSSSDKKTYKNLYGIACDAVLSTGGMSFRENILFTHLGLSGPASLQGSLYWHRGESIELDLCPDLDMKERLTALKKSGTRKNVKSLIKDYLPNKLADRLVTLIRTDGRLAELSNAKMDELVVFLKNHQIKPVSTVGFVKAEVTKGGVDTSELSSKTMQSSKVPGLFFIGEVVDVTGQLGGYNFQWAWASGHAAGQFV